jgi:hypothetical protein
MSVGSRYTPRFIRRDASVFKNCYLNFSYPRPAMKSVARASDRAVKERRKRHAASDSSDDSESDKDFRKKF